MFRIKALVRKIFGFSRTETNAFVILIPLMILLLASGPVYRRWLVSQPFSSTNDRARLDSLIATWQGDTTDVENPEAAPSLFPFNPNTATQAQLAQLGLNNKLATRILNYRAKGGSFKIKSDFKKIYGLDTALYATLYPYLQLPDKLAPPKPSEAVASTEVAAARTERKPFDLNQADTTLLKSIFGIGSKRAWRIVEYREKLGGLIDFAQLTEVYSLDSVVIAEVEKRTFISPDFVPRKLHINTATEKELAAHPYLTYKLAKAIVAYRFQHGHFQTIEDLGKITLLPAETINKIKPYLSFD